MFKSFVERHLTSYIDRPLNIIVYFMYVGAIALAVLSGTYKALYDVLALFFGRMVIWAYLMYIDRSLPRVTQGVYIVELMVLFAIIISNCLWVNKKKERAKLPRIAGVAYLQVQLPFVTDGDCPIQQLFITITILKWLMPHVIVR
jgi:hypothetical protein